MNAFPVFEKFTYGIDEREFHFREEYGKWYAGETAAGADIKDLCLRSETDDAGNAKAMEHVMWVEIVDVLTADDVNLCIPFAVQGIQSLELLGLER